MPVYTDLYPQICAFENLYLAYRKARKGKRGRAAVRSRAAAAAKNGWPGSGSGENHAWANTKETRLLDIVLGRVIL